MEDADDLVSMLAAASINIVHIRIHRQLQQSYYNNTISDDGTSGSSGNSDPGATLPPTRPPTQPVFTSDATRNRTILTILYVCVLSICFVTPLFYFLRLHLEDRHARRLRELEIAGIRSALQRSAMEENSQNNNEQSRAMRHKYIEERRARILQLFAPVKMILKRENFPHLLEEGEGSCEAAAGVATSDDNEERRTVKRRHEDDDDDVEAPPPNNDNEDGGYDGDLTTNEEEDHRTVLVPVPGLFFSEDAAASAPSSDPAADAAAAVAATKVTNTANPRELRLAPAVCTICLCSYKIGSEIVWSSNADCEHCFHADCMERWLLRQRERPLCPCCRRDFIIDPYDVDENDNDMDDDDNDDDDQIGGGYGENEEDGDGEVEAPERAHSLRNSSSTTGFQQPQANDGSTWPVTFVWEEPRGSDLEERSNV